MLELHISRLDFYTIIKLLGVSMKFKNNRASGIYLTFICGFISVFIEIFGIILVSRGSYLEALYCQDIYAWWITTGALLFACGSFIQKKLPWAYTRLGEIVKYIKGNKDK